MSGEQLREALGVLKLQHFPHFRDPLDRSCSQGLQSEVFYMFHAESTINKTKEPKKPLIKWSEITSASKSTNTLSNFLYSLAYCT